MAELLGRETGVCAGRAGSMNVIDLEHRLVGCYGIVGGSIAAATGVALALKRRGGVAVAFFGDGATNQGYFHECLNFAKVQEPPGRLRLREQPLRRVHALRERHGGGDPRARRGRSACRRTPSTATTSGRSSATAAEAVRRAREGGGPQFVESLTYRYVGHSRSDPGKYRKPGELDEWKLRDPLLVARAGLAERYGTSEEALDAVDAEVEEAHGSRRRGREGRAVPGPRGAGDGVQATRPHPQRARNRQEGGPRGPERDGLPHGDLPGARRGARARRLGHLLRRGRRRGRRRLRHHGRPASTSTAPTASSTPRSPSSPWPARPTAAPSAACARSSRSCSATSCR